METTHVFACVAVLLVLAAPAALAQDLPDWASNIRTDHPRLFFNADTWPQVRERALNEERAWYDETKSWVDRLLKQIGDEEKPEPRDLGPQAAQAAFVYLMTGEKQHLDLAKKALDTALRFYDKCYEERKAVNWYSTTRVHALLAWDWLYNDLTEDERREYLSRLIGHLQDVYTAKPRVYRENISGYTTGFYGVNNCKWFVGCAGLGEGIEEKLVREWLVWGYNESIKLLNHRKRACGDDGGGGSPTLGYIFGAYPWSEQNFFYTWLSAMGENIAPDWPHSAWLTNYVIWNWIATEGSPLEFGYGDTPHTTNRMSISHLYTHMANIRHLYGEEAPQAAALARHLQDITPYQKYTSSWFIYPFLLTNLEKSPEPFKPDNLPRARHFENMGQIFMRSGAGPDDTYCLFTCGGVLGQHRHFDAVNFVIYHKGHLALDSGTRYSEFKNGQHLKNYYAQTVAHNCVLIHQPGEPPANYWGEGPRVAANHGGQHHQLGSVPKAFETNDQYVYVAGDATPCYQHGAPDGLPQKTTLVTRQLVFLMPNHFVIFDRVNVTDPSYKKEWLLHTAHEPLIEGKTFRADHVKGRLFCRTLLPEDAALTPVGGPGKEFWAAGKNWVVNTEGLKPEQIAMMGQWRVEVSPGAARTDDLFLHVIQVGGQTLDRMDSTELIQRDNLAGVRLKVGGKTWEVLFNTQGDLGGHIKLSGGDEPLDRALTTQVTPQVGILATAL